MNPVESPYDVRRRQAFEALRQIAAEYAARGRRCLAASAKPAMVARVGFDETDVGYPTFRALLSDAEREGWVSLSYIPSGDVNIAAPLADGSAAPGHDDLTPSPEAARPTNDRPLPPGAKIRHDLWNAIIKESETWFYDPAADAVVTGSSAETRDNLISLPTADADAQNDWINQFLETLEENRRNAIAAVVAEADDPRAKNEVLTSQRVPIRNAWYAWRTRMVLERLQNWKETHSLGVDLLISRPTRQLPRSARSRQGTGAAASSERPLRERLHRAIDQMPTSELLRLSIPVEFLIDA